MPKSTIKKEKKAKVEKVHEEVKTIGLFTLTLTLADRVYSENSDKILDALNNLSPDLIKTRGTFSITDGTRTVERTFYVAQLKKLLANRTAKEIFEKRTLQALGLI